MHTDGYLAAVASICGITEESTGTLETVVVRFSPSSLSLMSAPLYTLLSFSSILPRPPLCRTAGETGISLTAGV